MSKLLNILIIFGTRPEAIKFAPLYFKLKKHYNTKICVSAQHREMLDQVLDFFEIIPDYDLNIMTANQTLFDVTSKIILSLKNVMDDFKPDLVFVQGDTSTTFIGALAGFYQKIPIAHLEAGLRTYNKYSPFPEEMNRLLTSRLADYHFVPCQVNKENLIAEGINRNIFIVGNTVIDAMFIGLDIIKNKCEKEYFAFFNFLDFNKNIILITGHRRENIGAGFNNICEAIRELAGKFPNVQFVYPVHLNPLVQATVNNQLSGISNVFLIHPLDYPKFIWLMNKAYLIMTDSGGVQEEAPALGKPVLVTREETERMEGVMAGTAILVGTDKEKIIVTCSDLLLNQESYNKMSQSINPYGDGRASEKIYDIICSASTFTTLSQL